MCDESYNVDTLVRNNSVHWINNHAHKAANDNGVTNTDVGMHW